MFFVEQGLDFKTLRARDALHNLVPFVQFKKREKIAMEECYFS